MWLPNFVTEREQKQNEMETDNNKIWRVNQSLVADCARLARQYEWVKVPNSKVHFCFYLNQIMRNEMFAQR